MFDTQIALNEVPAARACLGRADHHRAGVFRDAHRAENRARAERERLPLIAADRAVEGRAFGEQLAVLADVRRAVDPAARQDTPCLTGSDPQRSVPIAANALVLMAPLPQNSRHSVRRATPAAQRGSVALGWISTPCTSAREAGTVHQQRDVLVSAVATRLPPRHVDRPRADHPSGGVVHRAGVTCVEGGGLLRPCSSRPSAGAQWGPSGGASFEVRDVLVSFHRLHAGERREGRCVRGVTVRLVLSA